MTIRKMARYTIRASEIETVRKAIAQFVNDIEDNEPATLYEAFALADKVSFVHTMCFADADAEQYHRGAPHTKRFVEVLYPRCETAPEFIDLNPVASTSG
ncbi:MAG: hypothetical protein H0U63_07820 [Burkholderiales bacterium]|nr:hypothetical protein [Burkholderiales bacterium]